MRLTVVALLIGIALVFYLSWIPQPKLKYVWFIPNWLGAWTDTKANENLRTAVPLVFLGLLAGFLIPGSFSKNSALFRWVLSWLILVAVVAIAEAGQLFLPHRSFSWPDIGWGAAGALTGLLLSFLIITFRKRASA